MIGQFIGAVAPAAAYLRPTRGFDVSIEGLKVTLVYDEMPPDEPGTRIRVVMIEYEPGGFSPALTHPHSAFIHATVLEGMIRRQVNDGPVRTYRTGESLSEYPGDRCGLSENASATEPARLLAVFVDTEETAGTQVVF